MKTINELYIEYTNTKSDKALENILKSNDLDKIINTQIKKLKLYNISDEDLYQNALIACEKLIKKYDLNYNVPLDSYLHQNLKYYLLDISNQNDNMKLGKGTRQKIKLAKKLLEDYPLEEAKQKFKEMTGVKKDKTINKYFASYFDLNTCDEDNTYEVSYNYSDSELINLLKTEVKLTDKRIEYIKLLFGLGVKKTKEVEIARMYNCSKANISKEIKKALEQIKNYEEIVDELKLRIK